MADMSAHRRTEPAITSHMHAITPHMQMGSWLVLNHGSIRRAPETHKDEHGYKRL